MGRYDGRRRSLRGVRQMHLLMQLRGRRVHVFFCRAGVLGRDGFVVGRHGQRFGGLDGHRGHRLGLRLGGVRCGVRRRDRCDRHNHGQGRYRGQRQVGPFHRILLFSLLCQQGVRNRSCGFVRCGVPIHCFGVAPPL